MDEAQAARAAAGHDQGAVVVALTVADPGQEARHTPGSAARGLTLLLRAHTHLQTSISESSEKGAGAPPFTPLGWAVGADRSPPPGPFSW